MSRPDDYRNVPPGGSWPPTTGAQSASPAGWAAESGRAAAGGGWSVPANPPGSGYPPTGRGGGPPIGSGSFQPVPGSVDQAVGGGSYQPVAGGPFPPGGVAPPNPAGGPAGEAGRESAPPAGTGHRNPIEPAKLFGIIIAALGALNFAFGFLPQVTASRIDESLSVYAVGPGYVPILLLIAGLLALAAFLPGSERSRLAVAAVSVGGAVGALISLGTSSSLELLAAGQVSKGLGAVLLTIFGIIQAVVAIAAYVVGADLRFAPRSGPAAGPIPGGADPSAHPGWMAAVPAPVWSAPSPDPSAAPTSPADPGGSGGYYHGGYPPAPGRGVAPAEPDRPNAAMSTWGPPADDDRPTGPQPVIDPEAADSSRRSPAERELPRVAPGGPDRTGPAEWGRPGPAVEPAERSGPNPEPRSRHSAGDATGPAPIQAPTQTPPAIQAPPSTSDGPDEGVTEVYRIPPRNPPDGPAGS